MMAYSCGGGGGSFSLPAAGFSVVLVDGLVDEGLEILKDKCVHFVDTLTVLPFCIFISADYEIFLLLELNK